MLLDVYHPFPGRSYQKIYTVCRNFFWNSKHPVISWKTVCMPKECGGLGPRNLHAWNKALLCKILWNIHGKKDSLWIKWVHHYYFTDFLSYSTKREDSSLIKSLIQIQNELQLNGEPNDIIIGRLQSWFTGHNASLEITYQWFFNKRIFHSSMNCKGNFAF